MTIAIGINLGRYVILAADTRTTYYPPFGKPLFRDDSEKIQKTGIGLITGAGLISLLDPVKTRLANESITNTNDIIRIVREEREKTSMYSQGHLQEALKKTGWIFTYQTFLNGPHLRLAITHPELGKNIGYYAKKAPAIICPIEANQKQAEDISEMLSKFIRSTDEITELQENIQYHTKIITRLIKTIHEQFSSVSAYCQIGIHTVDGQIGISPIIRGDEHKVSFNLN